jgi:hypothetical protein
MVPLLGRPCDKLMRWRPLIATHSRITITIYTGPLAAPESAARWRPPNILMSFFI